MTATETTATATATATETAFKTANPNSKRGKAIVTMIANASLPMAEVLPLMVAEAGLKDLGEARSFYKYLVENNFAPGVVAARVKPVKAAKAAAEPKVRKVRTNRMTTDAPAATADADKAAEVKAANLARMKEVLARSKQKSNRKPLHDLSTAEVTDMSGFEPPAFLTKNQVRALV